MAKYTDTLDGIYIYVQVCQNPEYYIKFFDMDMYNILGITKQICRLRGWNNLKLLGQVNK